MPAHDGGPPSGPFRIVVVGHVDHGKSTLIGRLMHDTGSLPTGKVEMIEAMSRRRGMPIEWSFVLDSLQAERDQGITIDSTQIWFKSPRRAYVIIDAPGHREFVKNMVSGAASSDAALLVVDAAEGVQDQTRRHGYLLRLLDVKQIAVIVNKMDLVDNAQQRFEVIRDECQRYLGTLGVPPRFFIPTVARSGANLVRRSEAMAWYSGPTLVEALDQFSTETDHAARPLRLPIQDIYKFDERRILVGRVESGHLRVGDTLLFSPSSKRAQIRSIESWASSVLPKQATAGDCVGITLDQQIFVERGEVASHVTDPPFESKVFHAKLFWFSDKPLRVGDRFKLRLNTLEAAVVVQAITKVIDAAKLAEIGGDAVERHNIAEVTLRSRRVLPLDTFTQNYRTGRFVLMDGYDVVGGGVITLDGLPNQREGLEIRSTNILPVEHRVTAAEREHAAGHRSGVLWFTGLPGSGKSTLALMLEQELFNRGYQVYVLDGDNIRGGLNANLGFTPEDRVENIRRVSEVAALFADAGFIAITAFISPYRQDRERARQATEKNFHEIFLDATLEVCERRDPKGHYRRARRGEIPHFTGVSAPYEEPLRADLIVDTGGQSVQACLKQLLAYVEQNFRR